MSTNPTIVATELLVCRLLQWSQDSRALPSQISSSIFDLTARLIPPCQSQLPDLLKTGIFGALFTIWNAENAPKEIVDSILALIRAVSDGIMEGGGPLAVGFRHRNIYSNKLVIKFYSNMYQCAFSVENLPLASKENHVISDDFVNLLEENLELLKAWSGKRPFVPIDFFLRHFSVFPQHVAKCFFLGQTFKPSDHSRARLSYMVGQLMWDNDTSDHMLPASHWKLSFFETFLNSALERNHYSDYFGRFLLLITSWRMLFQICLHFMKKMGTNSEMNTQIINAIECRMRIYSTAAAFEALTEYEVVSIMEYMGRILACQCIDVTIGLFYVDTIENSLGSWINSFESSVSEIVTSRESLQTEYNNYVTSLKALSREAVRRPIDLSAIKSLPSFLFKCLRNFFVNSTLINKSMMKSISIIVCFDFLNSTQPATRLLVVLAQVIESIDTKAFQRALLFSRSPDQQLAATTYNWLGAKQNIVLFEKIIVFSYAALKAKVLV